MRDQFEARARKIARDTGCGDDWVDTIADILRAAVDLSRAPAVHPEAAPRAEALKPMLSEWDEGSNSWRYFAANGDTAVTVDKCEWWVWPNDDLSAKEIAHGIAPNHAAAKRAADVAARQWYTLPEDRAPGRLPDEPAPPSEPIDDDAPCPHGCPRFTLCMLCPLDDPRRPDRPSPASPSEAPRALTEADLSGDEIDEVIAAGDDAVGCDTGIGREERADVLAVWRGGTVDGYHDSRIPAWRVAMDAIRARRAAPPADTLESLWAERDRLARDLNDAREALAGWRDMAGIVRKALGAGDGESIPSAAVRVAGERDEAQGKVQRVQMLLTAGKHFEGDGWEIKSCYPMEPTMRFVVCRKDRDEAYCGSLDEAFELAAEVDAALRGDGGGNA